MDIRDLCNETMDININLETETISLTDFNAIPLALAEHIELIVNDVLGNFNDEEDITIQAYLNADGTKKTLSIEVFLANSNGREFHVIEPIDELEDDYDIILNYTMERLKEQYLEALVLLKEKIK